LVLGPGDAAKDSARSELLGIQAHAPHDLLDDGLLVVFVEDGEGTGKALVSNLQCLNIAPKKADTKRMERGDERLGERGVVEQAIDSGAHLCCRLVGKGDGENGVGGDALFADKPCNAAGDDARLSGASTGQNKQRALGSLDRGALFGIEVGDKRRQDRSPAGRVLYLV